MEIIVRDGIRIPIPAAVTSEGGAAVQAFVDAVPATLFPAVPAELRQPNAGKAYDAYLGALQAAGRLASHQQEVDAWVAAHQPPLPAAPEAADAADSEVARGLELARRALAAPGSGPVVSPAPARTPAPSPAPDKE